MELMAIGTIVISFLVLLILIGLVIARLYKRSTREVSLVRTGAGGKKVIMDGGTLVIPLFHEVMPVNMKTLRLEVRRTGEGALITQDRLRVDAGVEFYVSVAPDADGIARAAQTLGDRTFDVNALREMIEGKLVDALRAVAAKMTMDDLHENRASFVQEVQNTVAEELLKNGLGLESVSLTALDQTPFEDLDENNAFNAVGMRKLAEVIAKSKKERAAIQADANVAVAQAEKNELKQKLEIEKEERAAAIQQKLEIETLEAAQAAEIAKQNEASEKEKEQARIAREEAIRAAEIASERDLDVADQERKIVVNRKSEEESHAKASADAARAEATKAEEAVTTARQVAEAERTARIELIDATKNAEKAAVGIKVSAEAEKAAAEDRATAVRVEAQADADALTIRADAKKADMLAEAEGQRAIVDAENSISPDIIGMKVKLEQISAMPNIIAEMVKPAEKIDSIRIHQLGGSQSFMNREHDDAGRASNGADKPVVNQAIDSILGMSLQLPALKEIGREIGVSMGEGVEGLMGNMTAPATHEPESNGHLKPNDDISPIEVKPMADEAKISPDPKAV